MKNRAGLLALAVLVIAILLMVFFVMPRIGGDATKVGDAINQASTELKNTVNEAAKTSRSAVADSAAVADPGVRGGTAFGTVLLTVPALALLHQAVRLGTAARERRLAALRAKWAKDSKMYASSLRAICSRCASRRRSSRSIGVPPGWRRSVSTVL